MHMQVRFQRGTTPLPTRMDEGRTLNDNPLITDLCTTFAFIASFPQMCSKKYMMMIFRIIVIFDKFVRRTY